MNDSRIGRENRSDNVDNRSQLENQSAEIKVEVEDDHDGSEDEDDDEGTRTYWRVKAKEGHKVSLFMIRVFVLLRFFCIAPEKEKSRHSRHSPFFHKGCSCCNSQRQD